MAALLCFLEFQTSVTDKVEWRTPVKSVYMHTNKYLEKKKASALTEMDIYKKSLGQMQVYGISQ